MNDCHDDQAIRTIFNSEDYLDALLTTGYAKPVATIAIRHKGEIKEALKIHFMLKAVFPEINEFRDGLKVLGVLDQILKYLDITRSCFVDEQAPLTAGMFRILTRIIV